MTVRTSMFEAFALVELSLSMAVYYSFALLVAVASVHITADAPKKKIRIHLPQKVKHIHHHKKIYITNHPASSQYAPAFMPSAEGAVALPTNVAMPAVASVLNTVELYDESPTRLPGISSAASKLLPLYRARGYYGPTPTEWDDQDYDLGNDIEHIDESNLPTGFAAPSAAPTGPSNYSPQRVKIIKINEPTRKKVVRKNKQKRVPVRSKPQPLVDDELPVTTFHEQFYSDLDSSGTIRKVKKPQRVEKIIDGDTEHIHTYSEEHIHKLVFGDGVKLPRAVGIDAVGSMSAFAPSHSQKNAQSLIAMPPDTLTRFTTIGSMGTPSHHEYSAYNPREVTHDHIFHDHGEIPPGVDLSKDHLPLPPRVTYSSQGLRIGVAGKFSKTKYPQKYLKPLPKQSPYSDFSYYEQIYAPYNKVRNLEHEDEIEDTVVSSSKLKSKGLVKPRNLVPAIYYGHGKQVGNYRQQQASASSPYSVSSTVVHEYKPKHYSNQQQPNKDIYSYPNNNYEYDAHPSSSNVYPSDNYPKNYSIKKGKKKSVSTQNISFGGFDHQTSVDHLEDSAPSRTSMNGVVPTAFDNSFDQTKFQETAHPSAFMIRQDSPSHNYYTALAIKALHSGDQLSVAEASNDIYQYAKAPSPSTTANEGVVATTATPLSEYYDVTSSETITTETTNYDTRSRDEINEQSSEVSNVHKEPRTRFKIITIKPKRSNQGTRVSSQNLYKPDSDSVTGIFKYGDKI
ncbi:unnamed protein product [Arctia plantaginis]|uniref:Uncharacterized protein n=1 Tax=Arctia plantaginis TaxID=874455 RepID=A0A8S0Z0L7_ARCPL|nr:unnamed protein product [Arctia plantaginis]